MADPVYFTPDDLTKAGGIAARWLTYAVGDTADVHPKFDDAALAATKEIDEYMRRRGISVPLDSLDASFKARGVAIVMDYLSMWADRRPETIDTNATAARAFFERVATGRQSVQDPDPTTPGEKLVASGPFGRKQPSVFDSTDPNSDISKRLPPI